MMSTRKGAPEPITSINRCRFTSFRTSAPETASSA